VVGELWEELMLWLTSEVDYLLGWLKNAMRQGVEVWRSLVNVMRELCEIWGWMTNVMNEVCHRMWNMRMDD